MRQMRIPLFHVNAFTNRPFSGNPAAVCPLQDWLDDGWLRKVAAENNLSETAFFVPRGDHYDLRWFTPRCEVRLCGHATLASAYVVLNLLQPGLQIVRFETRLSGVLSVCLDGDIFSMDFPARFGKTCAHPPEKLIRGLGPGPLPSNVIEANNTYIAVYETQAVIQNIRPDFARLEQLHPFTVAVTAPGKESDFVSRYFAPSYGVPEDPVTGSAHCALTPYWAEHLVKTHLYARQVSEREGELWCEMAADRVILKGSAVLTLQGSLQI
ncbi:MAG: PhzF family phenazine biosynthesis protein [Candidatus Sulfotelmatobacter sp.]|jgi:PhzF family phenazine biosynthesis protein